MINPAPESRSNMKINFMAVPRLDGNCLKVKSKSSTAVLSLRPLGQIAAAVQVLDRWIFDFCFFGRNVGGELSIKAWFGMPSTPF